MTRPAGFHPEARAEFYAAVDWYDKQAEGIGPRFETAVLSAIEDALTWPGSGRPWPGWTGDPAVRAVGVPGFPYQVVYYVAVEDAGLVIVAIAHEKRIPGYWRDRFPR